MYKLRQPDKKPLSDRLPFYLFAGLLCFFLVWIMLIRPMTLPADKMPFIFDYDKTTHKVLPNQKRDYFIYTAGPILVAVLFMIPVARNSNQHDYAMALLWANRNNIKHEDFMRICDLIKPYILKDNGSKALIAELQKTVDGYKGKDQRVKDYGMKKQYAEDLVLA